MEYRPLKEYIELRQGLAINKGTSHLVSDFRDNHFTLPLLRIADMMENSYTKYISKDVNTTVIAGEKDIIYTRTGQVGLVFRGFSGVVHNNSFIINVINKDIDEDYLFVVLQSEFVRTQALNLAKNSVQPDLTHDKFKSIIIPVPDINIQKQIASNILQINSKIENNNKINKELESMAKAIYDYWFLQFEFPNKEGKPYKSSGGKMVWNEKLKREIPEGWECVKLNEVFNFVKGKIPTDTFCVSDDKHSIPYLTIDAVNNNNCEYCSEENMILTDGEVLMVMDGAASSEVYIGNKGAIGSTFCKLELKDKLVSNELLYLIMRKYESIFKKVNTGSTVPHANKNYINNFRICLPKDNMQLEKIQKHIIVNIKQINMRKRENKELVLLRDFLLPILMNGQVGFRELALAGD